MPKDESKKKVAVAEKEEATVDAGTASEPEKEKTPTTNSPVVREDKDVVEVSRDDLANFMKRLNDLEADNKKLLEVADKARMAAISERERVLKGELPQVKLTRLEGPSGKLVVAWQTTANESYVDGNRLVERQEIELFFQDGTSERMPLLSFYRKQNKETKAVIVSRTTKEGGMGEMLHVRLESGEEIDIDLKFVN
jgi:hypothetical protein